MSQTLTPFTRFQNRWFFVLLVVYIAYSAWFMGVGPYGKLAALGAGMPLEERGYYTGAFAVETLSALNSEGRTTKYLSLLFDIPYMIMSALVLEAMTAFGLIATGRDRSKWAVLLALPMLFLIVDILENSALAFTLASGSALLGSVAGLLTPLKFFVFSVAMIAALILAVYGLGVKLKAKMDAQ